MGLHYETMMNSPLSLNFSTSFHHTARSIATAVRSQHVDPLCDLWSIIKHPRSLARPNADWRPPIKQLPSINELDSKPWSKGLQVSITRHRVGPTIRHQLHVFNEATQRQAAYVVTLKIYSPTTKGVPQYVTEGWVRALVGEKFIDCVHEFGRYSAPTYVWVVDSRFRPIHSPASLFRAEPKSA